MASRWRAAFSGGDRSGSLLDSDSKSDAECDAKCHDYSEDYNDDDEFGELATAWRRGALGFPCWCVIHMALLWRGSMPGLDGART